MKYRVYISECITRNSHIDVEAEDENAAKEQVWLQLDDGELDLDWEEESQFGTSLTVRKLK